MKTASISPVNIKLNRAKRILNSLILDVQKFFYSNPYSVFESEDPRTGDWSLRLKINNNPPSEWSAEVGDIIHNLRSALDLLIYQLFIANGSNMIKDTGFPIYDKKKDLNKNGLKRIYGINPNAINIIKTIKPYRRGNLRLWQLHQVDIVDKHKIIIGIGGSHESVIIDSGDMFKNLENLSPNISFPSIPIGIRPADRQFPLKDGDILFSVKKGNDHENFKNTKNKLGLSFGDGKIIKYEPLVPTLQEFVGLVEDIINKLQPFINNAPKTPRNS